ncbi:MAG: hypothetical protein ACI9W1_000646, partial [Candidatus Azotimanducaceae bacterium]
EQITLESSMRRRRLPSNGEDPMVLLRGTKKASLN